MNQQQFLQRNLSLQGYWISECAFWQASPVEAEVWTKFRTQVLIYAASQNEATNELVNYRDSTEYIEWENSEVQPLKTYLQQCLTFESQMIQAIDQLSSTQPVWMLPLYYASEYMPINQQGVDIARWLAIAPRALTKNSPDMPWIDDETRARLFDRGEQQQVYCYGVINAALYHQSGRYLTSDLEFTRLTWRRCLSPDDPEDALEYVAPYLVDLTLYDDQPEDFHRQLFTLWQDQTIAVFIHSTQSFDEVYQHLSRLTRLTRTDNKKTVFLRFYHPPTLELVIKNSHYATLSDLMQPIESIWYIDHQQGYALKRITVSAEVRQFKPEPFTLNAALLRAFTQKSFQLLAKQINAFMADKLETRCLIPPAERENFIIHTMNQAWLLGLTLRFPILIYVSARSMSPLDDEAWLTEVEALILSVPASQELWTRRLFIKTGRENDGQR